MGELFVIVWFIAWWIFFVYLVRRLTGEGFWFGVIKDIRHIKNTIRGKNAKRFQENT